MIYLIISAVAAYLIGSINSSILISRIVSGKDIRESGSGNAGATNMLRTMGKKYAVITLIIDILKGVVAVLIARLAARYGGIEWGIYAAGALVCIGHCYPVFFGFKGGKGVATSLGVVLVLDWKIGLIVAAAAIIIMALTKYVSLGSVIGGAAFVVAEVIKGAAEGSLFSLQTLCAAIIGILLIARHHANIKRLINGTENKLSFKGGKK